MYLVVLPVLEKLQAFSLQPFLELALLPSELTELLKLQPESIKTSTDRTNGKDSFEVFS